MKLEIIIYDQICLSEVVHPMFADAIISTHELNISCEIKFISDSNIIRKKNITELPLLMINGCVKIKGRNPYLNELKYILLDEIMYEETDEKNLFLKIAIQ